MGIPVGNPNALVRPKMQKTGGKLKNKQFIQANNKWQN